MNDVSKSMAHLSSAEVKPVARVVLLGASNLTRAMATVTYWTQRFLGGPLDFHFALGHGRSYGESSHVLGRSLPGIASSRLWDDLADLEPLPTFGLIADIGNDILYRFPVPSILEWIDHALQRMRRLDAKLAIVQLPTHSVRHANALQFWLLKHVLFRGRNLKRHEVERDALAVADALERMAAQYRASLVQHDASWYGVDPIHILRSRQDEAWRQILAAWFPRQDGLPCAMHEALRPSTLYLRTLTPQQRWLFGFEQARRQPVGRLADGSRIFLY